jgi:hypothetical protein
LLRTYFKRDIRNDLSATIIFKFCVWLIQNFKINFKQVLRFHCWKYWRQGITLFLFVIFIYNWAVYIFHVSLLRFALVQEGCSQLCYIQYKKSKKGCSLFWHFRTRTPTVTCHLFATTSRIYLLPRSWRQHTAPKCCKISTRYHSQFTKTVLFEVITVITCNLTSYDHSEIIFREYGNQLRTSTFFGVRGKVTVLKYNEENQKRHLQGFLCSLLWLQNNEIIVKKWNSNLIILRIQHKKFWEEVMTPTFL